MKPTLVVAAVLLSAAAMPGPQDPPQLIPAAVGPSVLVAPRMRAPRVSRSHVRPAVPKPPKRPRAAPRPVRVVKPRPAGPVNWDAIARCESGGHWNHHTSLNGYWGGLQESPRFWASFGGLRFAPRPDLATKAQQITVAVEGQKRQGWNAWPTCGRYR